LEEYLEHNKAVRAELLESVSGLTDEQLNKEVEDGRWTIMQVLEHLYLMERSITKAIQGTLEKGEVRPVDAKPIHLSVDRSRKVDAPSFVDPSKESITLDEMKEKLIESRKGLLQVVGNTTKHDLAQKSYPHPVFGLVSLEQWVPFIGYHEKRHLAQMEELKAKL
jgi:uncharacterized damage-inducible protein DinB